MEMAHYETTVRLTHISTSSKARSGLSVADAVGAAKAHLRYITRDDAAEDGNIIARTNGHFLDGSTDELKAAARSAIDNRSQKHTDAYGVRLADRLIVSLPNDATIAEQRQMCANILEDFTANSEAFGMAAIHTDKAGNNHAHFLFVDGLETLEAAKARRPDAKRVRRADALRLNEGGNRQEMRARVAASINAVALPAGRRAAEVRSYADRGIQQEPQQHEGPQVADKLERAPHSPRALTSGIYKRLKANAVALRKRLERETAERASFDADEIPARYRKGWLGGTLFGWMRTRNAERTAGQQATSLDAIDEGTAAFVADWSQQQPPALPAATRPKIREQIKEAARRSEGITERPTSFDSAAEATTDDLQSTIEASKAVPRQKRRSRDEER